MRGKANTANAIPENLRITPAYAGKSEIVPRFKYGIDGSPPPMRGKDPEDIDEDVYPGITPAYAGKRFQKFR